MAEIKNADVYIRDTKVLSNFNWTMLPDENWAVIGNNGVGKTTFLKLVFGELIPVYGGTVHWFGLRDLAPLGSVRSRMGFVSAEYQADYSPNLTGLNVVESGFFSSIGLYEKVDHLQRRAAWEWLDFLGISHLRNKGFRQMSYGEARRTLLARALVNDPDLLILDEPCAGLDIPSREHFLETVERLARSKTRLLYATHHIEELMPSITHVLYLKNGAVANQGRKADMLKNHVLSETVGYEVKIEENSGRYWVTGAGRIS